jgi:hypothetical protein
MLALRAEGAFLVVVVASCCCCCTSSWWEAEAEKRKTERRRRERRKSLVVRGCFILYLFLKAVEGLKIDVCVCCAKNEKNVCL